MKKPGNVLLLLLLFRCLPMVAQTAANSPTLARPKLVVGLMVDQMRWDFLYRYYDRYEEGGFKRLIHEGMSCDNTMISYAQTLTAPGHASVYTGTVPAVNGIVGNDWFDRSLGRVVYCVEDSTVKIIGGAPNALPMSPANLWTSTVTDELRMATNFQGKVIGIAIKDRGGILPAGRTANGAYWYDAASGNWVTSTYYMNELPGWAQSFNSRKIVDSLYKQDWNTLYPITSYIESEADEKAYEGANSKFPHLLTPFIGKNYQLIAATPQGNTMTMEFAKAALVAEGLGKDAITDFLAVSLSSPDYIGHQYGPNSIEAEDNYLRLDKELKAFFDFLDLKVGKGQYTVFLTADHGASHSVGFLNDHKFDAHSIAYGDNAVEQKVALRFGLTKFVLSVNNYQYYLDFAAIDNAKQNRDAVVSAFVTELNKDPKVFLAFDNRNINTVNLPAEVREMFQKGFSLQRGGDVQVILKAGNYVGFPTGTTHGSWYPYDAHVPLLFMGWGIKPGRLTREVRTIDIAPTLSALLHIQMPNGSIGKVIDEAIR
jgi:predicted AlkP superfamily pyrophosphatase or phosphodiesterase